MAHEGAQVAGELIDPAPPHGPQLLVESAVAKSAVSTSSSPTPRPPPSLCSPSTRRLQRAFESVLLSGARGARAALPHLEASTQAASSRSPPPRSSRPCRRSASRTCSGPGSTARQDARRGASAQGDHGQSDRARRIDTVRVALARRAPLRAQRRERRGRARRLEREIPLGATRADRAGRAGRVPLLEPAATSPGRRSWSTAASCARSRCGAASSCSSRASCSPRPRRSRCQTALGWEGLHPQRGSARARPDRLAEFVPALLSPCQPDTRPTIATAGLVTSSASP